MSGQMGETESIKSVLNRGPVRRRRDQAGGNGTLLVLVDSQGAYHDRIGRDLQNRERCCWEQVDRQHGLLKAKLSGKTGAALKLSLYSDRDDGFERSYVEMPVLDGSITIEVD